MGKEAAQPKRDPYPDILKGIAILLVILGHCIQFGSGRAYEANAEFQSNPLFVWIYSFHMPLFMIIAGYFTAGSLERYGEKRCLVRRAKSLVLPIFSWSVLYELYVWGAAAQMGLPPALNTLPGAWALYFFSSQWFLWAIFLYTVTLSAVSRFAGKYSFFLYLMLYLILCRVDVPGNFCNLNTYITNWPLFMLGYLLGEWKRERKEEGHEALSERLKKPEKLNGAEGSEKSEELNGAEGSEKPEEAEQLQMLENPAFLLHCFLMYVLLLAGQLTGWFQLTQLAYRIYYMVIGISGSVTVAAVVLFLYKKTAGWPVLGRCWNVLSMLGQKTMGIYILSGYLCTEILRRIPVNSYHAGIALLETLAVLLVSLAGMAIIERIPFGKKWLLGEK